MMAHLYYTINLIYAKINTIMFRRGAEFSISADGMPRIRYGLDSRQGPEGAAFVKQFHLFERLQFLLEQAGSTDSEFTRVEIHGNADAISFMYDLAKRRRSLIINPFTVLVEPDTVLPDLSECIVLGGIRLGDFLLTYTAIGNLAASGSAPEFTFSVSKLKLRELDVIPFSDTALASLRSSVMAATGINFALNPGAIIPG